MQVALWCKCGRPSKRNGLCRVCTRRRKLSREKFGGQREAALARDGGRCQVCAAMDDVLVHHRRPGVQKARWFATLCRGDHTRLEHLYRLRFGLPERLKELWRELHPDQPEQLELLSSGGDSAEQAGLFEAA